MPFHNKRAREQRKREKKFLDKEFKKSMEKAKREFKTSRKNALIKKVREREIILLERARREGSMGTTTNTERFSKLGKNVLKGIELVNKHVELKNHDPVRRTKKKKKTRKQVTNQFGIDFGF